MSEKKGVMVKVPAELHAEVSAYLAANGMTMGEAFGLIETVEKTAQIYMLTLGKVVNTIPDEGIAELAKLWNLKMLDGVLKL